MCDETFFTIDYLVENTIDVTNNTLHYDSERRMPKDLVKTYSVKMKSSHMNHVTCTRKQIMDYQLNIDITKDDLKTILNQLKYKIEDTRYIILRKD